MHVHRDSVYPPSLPPSLSLLPSLCPSLPHSLSLSTSLPLSLPSLPLSLPSLPLSLPPSLQRGPEYSEAYDSANQPETESGLMINPAVMEAVASKAASVTSNIVPDMVPRKGVRALDLYGAIHGASPVYICICTYA